MSRILIAPRRYIQGDGALREIGALAAWLGTRALLTGGKRALAACGDAILASLRDSGVACFQEPFAGECCDTEIARLVSVSRREKVDLVIAAGGGKTCDTGKIVAHLAKTPVIVVPTIAATDAPCSALSIIYRDDGVFDRCLLLDHNPDCVLVDTRVVAQAPVRTLVAGMGDALATFWEADTCHRSGRPNPLTGGDTPLRSAIALSRLCYDTLLEYGLQAKLAVERHCVTPAVEAIVEANILLSGLGFESGGLAAAHAVHNGLTVLRQARGRLHGEKVAFGTLVQLVMEGRPPAQVREVMDFCLEVGLPVCLDDLDIREPSPEDIRRVAEAATAPGECIHATWFEVTPAKVEAAIWAADALARDYRTRRTVPSFGTELPGLA